MREELKACVERAIREFISMNDGVGVMLHRNGKNPTDGDMFASGIESLLAGQVAAALAAEWWEVWAGCEQIAKCREQKHAEEIVDALKATAPPSPPPPDWRAHCERLAKSLNPLFTPAAGWEFNDIRPDDWLNGWILREDLKEARAALKEYESARGTP